MADIHPSIVTWLRSGDRGTSSDTIAAFMLFGYPGTLLASRWPDAPHDTSDVGRCVRLLDIAERARLGWRARMPELFAGLPIQWGPLRHHWPRIEAAYRRDVAAQKAAQARDHRERWISKDGHSLLKRPRKIPPLQLPPSESWWLVEFCRSGTKPLPTYPDEDGGGLWRPLDDVSPEPLGVNDAP